MAATKHQPAPLPSGYFQQSARPLVSLAFILPMLLAYEAGIFILGPKAVHNGAAVWLQNVLAALGLGQYVLLPLAACGILLGWHHLRNEPWKFSPWVLAGMLAESLGLAAVLLVAFRGLGGLLPAGGPLSLTIGGQTAELLGYFGAGIYEELLFRLILLTLIAMTIRHAGAPERASLITAVIVSSLIFAGAHYRLFAGSGDAFTWASFFFRTLAGVYFAAIFSLRGFGIAAGAHALYDVLAYLGAL